MGEESNIPQPSDPMGLDAGLWLTEDLQLLVTCSCLRGRDCLSVCPFLFATHDLSCNWWNSLGWLLVPRMRTSVCSRPTTGLCMR